LPSIDFATDLALTAFVRTPDAGWQFCVTHVTVQAQTVVLHTHLIQSPTRAQTVTSYFHLLRVPKEEMPSGEVEFQLALTRHLYVSQNTYREVIEATDEGIVLSVTGTIPVMPGAIGPLDNTIYVPLVQRCMNHSRPCQP
jgi:hypothetical protein